MKSKGTACLLWLCSFFGWLGFHHFYLGKPLKGIIWIVTFGVLGMGSLIDLFTLGGQVENCNTAQELKTIRIASMAAAATSIASNPTPKESKSKVCILSPLQIAYLQWR